MSDQSLAVCFPELYAFLPCVTPDEWIAEALKHQDILLTDHANCEKKAASTALNLMYRYTEHFDLLNKMSRLAREELRHFEQVLAIIKKRGIPYKPLSASRYAGALRKHVRTWEPARMVDTLIIGAYIEARSCERFHKLAPYLDDELKKFYLSLLKSEGRHFKDYLTLAESISDESIEERVAFFAGVEREAIESADEEFRFHSGVPVTA
ncbi:MULTISPECIES: tRNA-(ms[2]io[6]A)-hydroxylase [unclassified Endozoicomonas]|uniref:tRNA-(ms[2]io[6]A)-hydroxylase n=1 Tax=unclassified Endozoicomonas TaxID=2644528 RepID=UPI002148BC8F|nr:MULTISPECIES: tRNA isopentenyl-2-thiomethyl-A-37 hydroxylase MiaE [unclassified Endozoicomonas]